MIAVISVSRAKISIHVIIVSPPRLIRLGGLSLCKKTYLPDEEEANRHRLSMLSGIISWRTKSAEKIISRFAKLVNMCQNIL